MGGARLVLGRLWSSCWAVTEQCQSRCQGSADMLHPCAESGTRVDLEQVWSGFRAARVECGPCAGPGWFWGGSGAVRVQWLGRDSVRADAGQSRQPANMYWCGNEVDLEHVWSGVRAARVKWTACGVRLVLGRWASSVCAETEPSRCSSAGVDMLHSCTKCADKVDTDWVSSVRAAKVEWATCSARLVLGRLVRLWSSGCAETEQCQNSCKTDMLHSCTKNGTINNMKNYERLSDDYIVSDQ